MTKGYLANQNQFLVTYKISDKDVVDFSDDMTHLLRKQISLARVARYTSATFQIMSASAASALAAAGGPTTIVAALAGGSALMPSLQKIFKASDKANIFEDAAHNIELAKIVYLKTLPDNGYVPDDRFSPDAAVLYESTYANIDIVEKRINDLLPTIAEIQAAGGTVNEIPLEPSVINLTFDNTTASSSFVTANNQSVTPVSLNTAVATVNDAKASKIAVTPTGVGSTQIVVTNEAGQTGFITVNVNAPPVALSDTSATVHPGQPFLINITEAIDATKQVTAQPADPDIVTAHLDTNKLLTLTGGNTLGTTRVTVSYDNKITKVLVNNTAPPQDTGNKPPASTTGSGSVLPATTGGTPAAKKPAATAGQ